MPITILQVDAFTDRPFTGNPAAVCFLTENRDDRWMQQVAREMNLSETAFLLRLRDGWGLRWFTPTTEVDLCGHATLASAHALWEMRHLSGDEVARFHTKSGLLTARRAGETIEMDFPAEPAESCSFPTDLARALGISMSWVGMNRFDYLVEIESEKALRALNPDLAALAELEERGVIVTARSSDVRFDFVSRFFAPRLGVDEDPVTGSAHCALGPYWGEKLGKEELTGYQASQRGGVVRVGLAGERVRLGGKAVTVLRGQLLQ